jgi:flagellin-like hook-associated protein FlgL
MSFETYLRLSKADRAAIEEEVEELIAEINGSGGELDD